MIFQEPMTSLNPVTTVGDQVMEAIGLHADLSRAEARGRALELFGLVGIPDPRSRFSAYPHQLSGGLKQRVMIAMAHGDAAAAPDRRRADHRARRHHPRADPGAAARPLAPRRAPRCCSSPTTSASSTRWPTASPSCTRARSSRRARAWSCWRPAPPLHPGPAALDPRAPRRAGEPLEEIKGAVPRPGHWPSGCRFHTRCPRRVRALPRRRARSARPCRATQSASCHLARAREARP